MNDTKILRYETAVWQARHDQLTQVARAAGRTNVRRDTSRRPRVRWSRRLAAS